MSTCKGFSACLAVNCGKSSASTYFVLSRLELRQVNLTLEQHVTQLLQSGQDLSAHLDRDKAWSPNAWPFKRLQKSVFNVVAILDLPLCVLTELHGHLCSLCAKGRDIRALSKKIPAYINAENVESCFTLESETASPGSQDVLQVLTAIQRKQEEIVVSQGCLLDSTERQSSLFSKSFLFPAIRKVRDDLALQDIKVPFPCSVSELNTFLRDSHNRARAKAWLKDLKLPRQPFVSFARFFKLLLTPEARQLVTLTEESSAHVLSVQSRHFLYDVVNEHTETGTALTSHTLERKLLKHCSYQKQFQVRDIDFAT